MSKRSLTAAAVERIKPPAKGQVEHFDASFPGLALRVSHGGRRAWVYFFRLKKTQIRMTMGVYPAMSLSEARDKWREARSDVERGIDPRKKQPERQPDTFESVALEWLKRDQAGNRSIGEVERVLSRDVLPLWADHEIDNITRRDVLELLDTIADRGAVTLARRTHSYLHRLFRWAVGRGIVETNPLADLPKPGREIARDRVLDDDELLAIWQAADRMGYPFGTAVKLLILTAARRDEISLLQWNEINLDKAEIRLKSERTKTGEPRIIPLAPMAIEILRETPRLENCDYVFSTTGRSAISGWSKAKTKLDAAAAEINGESLISWRLHDLRRSAATGLQRLGEGLQVVEAVLGHTSGSRSGVVGIYQRHQYEPEKRIALNRWARLVSSLVEGKPVDNVIALSEAGV